LLAGCNGDSAGLGLCDGAVVGDSWAHWSDRGARSWARSWDIFGTLSAVFFGVIRNWGDGDGWDASRFGDCLGVDNAAGTFAFFADGERECVVTGGLDLANLIPDSDRGGNWTVGLGGDALGSCGWCGWCRRFGVFAPWCRRLRWSWSGLDRGLRRWFDGGLRYRLHWG
jgi:hypothetical protein